MHRHEHVVQLYGSDDRLLARNVSRYLAEGFARGDGLLLIATPAHAEAIVTGLSGRGIDVPGIVRDGRLAVIDAETTLARFMKDGSPDERLFDDVVGGALRTLRRRAGSPDVCAYGEMVGILWTAGELAAAERLEALWNTVVGSGGLRLYCAYAIDVLGRGSDTAAAASILAAHGAVIPTGDDLQAALSRAMRDVLGDEAEALPAAASAEAMAVGLQAGGHRRAREILDRARYYQDFHRASPAPPA